MPSRWKTPRLLLSRANSRSPCRTLISTEGWLSAAVEKTWLLWVGMVVLRSMILVQTPPRVSMPRLSRVYPLFLPFCKLYGFIYIVPVFSRRAALLIIGKTVHILCTFGGSFIDSIWRNFKTIN